jgi:hypothetical protein
MAGDSYTGVDNTRHLMNEVSVIVSPCAWVHLMAQTTSPPQARGILILENNNICVHLTLSWSVEILLKCLTLNSATMANLYFGQQLTIIFTGCIWRGEGQFVPSFQIFCFRTISDPLDHAMNLQGMVLVQIFPVLCM